MKTIKNRTFKILGLLNLIISVAQAQHQNTYKVSGRLSDEKGQPLDYATVSLLKAADSALIKGTLSSATGTFTLEQIPAGKYIIRATTVGYGKSTSSVFEVSSAHPDLSLPTLILPTSSKSLATVTITASKPIIDRKIDRTVMNVENSILSAGNTAMEILARAPGVTIDKDDNISLNGKGGVNVMINDKMTYLSAAQLSTLLRSTDGNTIKSIELMTNPSAKYDASGNAGIINIRLKKNTQTGTNGSLTLGAGYGKHEKENGTLTLNHQQGNLNVFSSFSHSDNKTEFRLSQQRVVTDSGQTYFDQHSKAERISHNNSYRLGADLATGSRNTVGFLVNGYFNSSGSEGNSLTNIGQYANVINSSQDQVSNKSNNNKNLSLNFNDNLKLDTIGQQLSIDLDYSRFNNGAVNEYNTNFYLPDGTIPRDPVSLHQQTPSLIKIRTAKIDYTLPLAKHTKLEAGAKYSDVQTDNNLNAQRLQNGGYVNDTTLTNRFVYDEKVSAGYVNLSQIMHNTSIQAGLRAEYTSSDGNLINTGSEVKRSYINFFPSIFINQKINDKNDIGLSYSKRVDRPEYDNLNPFIYYLDQYSYQQGNPFLNPQYTNKFEFNYTYNHGFNIGVGYSHTYDYLTSLPLTDPATKITVYTTLNLQKQNYYNISISSPYNVTKWWTGNVNAVGYYSGFKTDSLLGGQFDRGQVSLHLEATQYFQITKSYKAEINGTYDSPFVYGIYHFGHNAYGDFGLSHSFADTKANLKFSVTDVFNTYHGVTTSKFQSNDITLHAKGETRVARVTFTYNFGSSSLKTRQHRTGADDEKSRVGR
ncbi:TonB-dependent receptor domain-containing protein [Mucilaginibacter sp.]|jgi:hypothetical protein|uniref:TonB-dependent receptor domain-containing protein n=1 Tax=Mucilaginibacter sp. TaxID=1882438 RepID=UPI0035655B7E